MSQKWEKPCVYGLDILGDFEILFRINLPETTGLAKKFHLGFSLHMLKSTPLHVPAAALLCQWLHVHPFLLCVLWRGHWDWCVTAGVKAAPRGQECRVSGYEATWALFIIEMSSPDLFASRNRFLGRQFFHGLQCVWWGMVWGWFKLLTFIVHLASIIIASAPPQIIRH